MQPIPCCGYCNGIYGFGTHGGVYRSGCQLIDVQDSFQEVDITGITHPITKHNYIVKDPQQLPQIIRRAFHIARSGRPGPVLVDIPKDIQVAMVDYTPVPLEGDNSSRASEEEIDENRIQSYRSHRQLRKTGHLCRRRYYILPAPMRSWWNLLKG